MARPRARDVLRVHPRNDPEPPAGRLQHAIPDRPNPIGLHRVAVAAIDGPRLRVSALKAVNGTPIVNVKPLLHSIDER